MQRRTKRFLSWGVLVVLMAVGLSSCIKNNNTPQTKMTYIYLMHMGPQLPGVELYFNNTKSSQSPFGFSSVSGQYGATQPGVFEVKFKKGNSDSLIASLPAALYDSLKPYTLIVYNDEQGKGQAMRIIDDFSDIPANTDKTWFRFLHMAPDAGEVDVFIGSDNIFSNRRLADNYAGTYEEFIPFTPGEYKITVKKAGTNIVLAETTSDVNMAKGYVKTFVFKGLTAGTGSQALAIATLSN